MDPLVPFTVTVNDPVLVALQESVEVVIPPLGGVTVVGFKLHVRPVEGETEAAKPTALMNPLRLSTLIAAVPGLPIVTLTATGLENIVKSGEAVTVNVIEIVCEREPLEPVTWTL